ncbi:hypothetical protein [Pseudanabaena sp. UWO310]|uniref:hypothetical protein n=1 Tax=Pseudanabaena sp. UWO310 TaxID=2480795 RepID=UPI00115BDB88|nr:hypothetical protein [Pseudanabaena sp. UWO310]TYQ30566.1 hypothetical protein PseudUWO310_07990 [Pseudanabaena sp. UWO310]
MICLIYDFRSETIFSNLPFSTFAEHFYLVHIHKPQKIDLEQIYPCPCPRRRGKLKPIALTDAFGCDRCPLLFQIEDDGYSLSQLGGLDSQRHHWQWTGKWQTIHDGNRQDWLEKSLTYCAYLLFVALIILWALNLRSTLGIPLAILLFTLLGLLIWRLLVIRRRDI